MPCVALISVKRFSQAHTHIYMYIHIFIYMIISNISSLTADYYLEHTNA